MTVFRGWRKRCSGPDGFSYKILYYLIFKFCALVTLVKTLIYEGKAIFYIEMSIQSFKMFAQKMYNIILCDWNEKQEQGILVVRGPWGSLAVSSGSFSE